MQHPRDAAEPALVETDGYGSRFDDVRPDWHGPNNHLALVYEGRDDQFATAVPFVRAGLDRGDRCLYVVDDNATDDVVGAMEAEGIDVAAARAAGSLSFHSTDDIYRKDGTFDPADVIAHLGEAVTEAVDERGFDHVRITGEMTWILDGERGTELDKLAEYEATINRYVPGEAITCVCQYNRNRFPEEVLEHVVRTHPQLVYDETDYRNFFYVPPERFLGERASGSPVEGRLDALLDRTERRETRQRSEPAQILRQALANARHVLDTGDVAIWRYDEAAGELEPHPATADEFDPGPAEGDLWEAFVTNESRVRNGPGEDGTGGESAVVVPLGRHGVFLAVRDEPFDGTHVEFAETIGANVRAALDRAHRETIPGERAAGERWPDSHRSESVTDLLLDLVTALVEASSCEALERAVCERVTDHESWQFAWVGETGATSDILTRRVSAGVPESYPVDDVEVADDPGTEPAGRAAATRSTRVVDDVTAESPGADWQRAALDSGVRSVVSTPLVYEDVPYGVLTVYGDRPGAFGDPERDALADIGRLVAFACNAIHRREALTSEQTTELDLRVTDHAGTFTSFVARIGGSVDVDGIVPQEDDRLRVFFSVDDATAQRVDDVAAESSLFTSLSLVSERETELVYDGVVDREGFLGTLLTNAAVPKSVSAAGDGSRVVVHLPSSADVASFVEMLDARYPGTKLLARRTVERTSESCHDFRSRLEADLTDRQWDALRTAYLSGYFEWPRDLSGEEVGARLDVSQPTFNRHLRDSLRKVLAPIFDDGGRNGSCSN